jgi:hypothetical protein
LSRSCSEPRSRHSAPIRGIFRHFAWNLKGDISVKLWGMFRRVAEPERELSAPRRGMFRLLPNLKGTFRARSPRWCSRCYFRFGFLFSDATRSWRLPGPWHHAVSLPLSLSLSLSLTLFSLCADSASKKLCFPGNTNICEHGWQTFLLLSSSFRALICTKHEKYRAQLQCNYSYLKGQQVFWICYHGISTRFLRVKKKACL